MHFPPSSQLSIRLAVLAHHSNLNLDFCTSLIAVFGVLTVYNRHLWKALSALCLCVFHLQISTPLSKLFVGTNRHQVLQVADLHWPFSQLFESHIAERVWMTHRNIFVLVFTTVTILLPSHTKYSLWEQSESTVHAGLVLQFPELVCWQ